MIMKFVVYTILACAVNGLRPIRTTTTTKAAPPTEPEQYPADARWVVESSSSDCDVTACSAFYTDKSEANACRDKVNCGSVRYLRAFTFWFCKASGYYVIPVDGQAGKDDSFWDGSEAFMYLPVVNAAGSSSYVLAKNDKVTLFNSTASSGGTSCSLDSAVSKGTIPDEYYYPADCSISAASSSMVRIDLTPFLEESYMGIDRNTIIIKQKGSSQVDLPAPIVGPYEGLVGVFHNEPSGALATLAASLLGVVVAAIVM